MSCNKTTKPDITDKQKTECIQCNHISKKKLWCCLFGFYVVERSKIIAPSKKLVYPSVGKMGIDFAKGIGRHIKSGFKNRTPKEQIVVMNICKKCESFVESTKIGPRCVKCGCCMSLKKRWATSYCEEGKWDK